MTRKIDHILRLLEDEFVKLHHVICSDLNIPTLSRNNIRFLKFIDTVRLYREILSLGGEEWDLDDLIAYLLELNGFYSEETKMICLVLRYDHSIRDYVYTFVHETYHYYQDYIGKMDEYRSYGSPAMIEELEEEAYDFSDKYTDQYYSIFLDILKRSGKINLFSEINKMMEDIVLDLYRGGVTEIDEISLKTGFSPTDVARIIEKFRS